MALAKAPARSTGKLTIQFGLVSVPVDVFNGVEEDANKISRNMRVKKTGAPVKFLNADGETGEIINRDETYYVVVTDDGTEVPLSDEEIDKAMGLTNGECNLVGFFDLQHLHAYETKSLLQVRPQTVKVGKKTTHPNVKPFALLMRGMQSTGTFALLTYVMRGKLHLAGLTSDGTLRDFYWMNELREDRDMPEVEVTEKEAAMALMLIDTMKQETLPVLENEAVKAVREFVDAKAHGEVVESTAKAEVPTGEVDLEALLAASLQAVK